MTCIVNRILLALLALAVVLAAPAGVAHAATKKVLVFRLTGSVPGAGDAALDRLTQVVARSAGLTGAEVTTGKVSVEDAGALAGCASLDAACLAQIAAVLHVDHVVLGEVTPAADGASIDVALTAFVDGKVTQEKYTIAVAPIDTMVEQLAREVPSLFVGSRTSGPGPGDEAAPATQASPAPAAATPAPPPAPRAHVRPYAWWITGGGAALAAGGAIFLVLAQGKQDDVNGAPTGSVDDFHHLQDLEDQGARDTTIGNVLLVAGGAALATGVALVLYQTFTHPTEEGAPPSKVALRPLVAPGAGGLTLELTWP